MGLTARGTAIEEVSSPGRAAEFPVVIVDAADGLEPALDVLREISDATRVMVCLPDVEPRAMSALIAEGAASVLGYPIEPDKLQRKVQRQLKRRRLPKRTR